MKVTELASRLRISPNAIKRWIKNGELKATMVKPPKGVGGHEYWQITEADFEEYLKKYY